jgi:hypothetical protein
MEYIYVFPDAYHDSTLRCFQDVKRVSPTHVVHPPPASTSPLEDPPLEPYHTFNT